MVSQVLEKFKRYSENREILTNIIFVRPKTTIENSPDNAYWEDTVQIHGVVPLNTV